MTRRTIRARLAATLLLLVIVAAGVAAVGVWVVLRAERDFRLLAEDRIPAVALAGELVEVTGHLAALAVRLVAEPAMPGAVLEAAVSEAAEGIAAVLAAPVLAEPTGRAPLRRAVEGAEADLRAALLAFSAQGDALDTLARAEARTDSSLRWTHADVQDQAQGLLRDLSFNMDAQLAVLVDDPDPARRAAAEAALAADQQLRDRLQILATEAATLTALLLQARSVGETAALNRSSVWAATRWMRWRRRG